MTEQKWTTGIELHSPQFEWEEIAGSNFYRAFWQELDEKEAQVVLNTPLLINGKLRKVEVAGWQMLDHGFTKLHEERVDEEMFVPTGRVVMGTVYKTGGVTTEEVAGFVSESELFRATFALMVAETEGLEHLALKLLGENTNPVVPKLVTRAGASHQTMSVGRSVFLVVKHSNT